MMKCFLCLALFLRLWTVVWGRKYAIGVGIEDKSGAQAKNKPVWFQLTGTTGKSDWFVATHLNKRNKYYTWDVELEDVGNAVELVIMLKKGFKFIPSRCNVDGRNVVLSNDIKQRTLRTWSDTGCSYLVTNMVTKTTPPRITKSNCPFSVRNYQFYVKIHGSRAAPTVDPLHFRLEGPQGETRFFTRGGFDTSGEEHTFTRVLKDVGNPSELIILTQKPDMVRISAAGAAGKNINFVDPTYFGIQYKKGDTALGCSWLVVPLNGGTPYKKSFGLACPFAGSEGLTIIGPHPTSAPTNAPTAMPTKSPTTELQGFEAPTREYSFVAEVSDIQYSQSQKDIRFTIFGDKGIWTEYTEKILKNRGQTQRWRRTVTNAGKALKLAISNPFKDGIRLKRVKVDGGSWVNIENFLIRVPWWEDDQWAAGCSFLIIDLVQGKVEQDGTQHYRNQFNYCPYPFMLPETVAPSPAPTISRSSCNGANFKSTTGSFAAGNIEYIALEAETISNDLNDVSFVRSPEHENWKKRNAVSGAKGSGYLYWTGSPLYIYGGQYQLKAKIRIVRPGRYLFKWRSRSAANAEHDKENDFWVRFSDASDYYAVQNFGENGENTKCPLPAQNNELPCLGTGSDRYEMMRYQGWFKVFKNVNTQTGSGWDWSTTVDVHGWFGQMVAVFDTKGTYTIELSARSPNLYLDRIVMFRLDPNQPNKIITDDELENLDVTKCQL